MICKKTEACFFELLKSPDVVRCKQKPLCLDFCDTRSEAVCKEKGKVYRLLNKDRLYKILSLHVDGRIVFSGGTPNIQNIPAFMSLQREFKRRKGSLIANEVLTDSVENIC